MVDWNAALEAAIISPYISEGSGLKHHAECDSDRSNRNLPLHQ